MGRGKANHIVLLGDSRIRQLRDGLIYHLTGMEHDIYANTSATNIKATANKHGSTVTVIPIANSRIEFFWMVEMDAGDGALGAALRGLKLRKSKPDQIIISSGVWIIKRCTAENITQDICLQDFRKYYGR
ncbi:hypothetical protein RvY_02855-1 [Ramazzottius varieornatus]|uniref:Uncharacterized protein n=2 Tax=Ramazzottius varieornatus TaxID=947166 RepID=A0A1D1UPJ6_RAMVA|nr:hypothetical protein RvY_02855-1 [Ramazzottius varieornatus]